MPSFHLRFVGHTLLPKSLSELDVEQGFGLSDKDVAAIHEKYKSKPDSRLGVAIQLSLLRATGRTPETVAGLPPALLRHLSKQVGARTTDLASLKTLYNRRATRFDHQAWAREFAGFSEYDGDSKDRLAEVLGELAISALSTDDLVQQAQLWLFAQQIIIPGDRPIRDLARLAFAAQDAASLAAVRAGVPERELKIAMSRLYAKRLGRIGGTVLEWLKTPPGKHGQISLSDLIKKVQYLQTLRVHEWKLAAIPIARLEAYSHAVVSRPPSDTAKLSDDQRTLELCCFLYVTLLELTDISMDMGGRRVCDVVRAASARVLERQARGSIDLRAQRLAVKNVLYDPRLTDKARIAKLKELLPKDENEQAGSRAALVRQSMVDDAGPKVAALVNAMGLFEFLGSEKARSIKQIAALRELAAAKARQLPEDFDLSIADPVWHPLLSSPDRKKALAALRACTISTVRKDVRGGKVWLAHSRKYRDREDQLIPADEWENKRKAFIRSLSLTDDPDKYLERVLVRVQESLQQLSQAQADGLISIDAKGHIHIEAVKALEVDPKVAKARAAMFEIIGNVQFGELLVELDAKTGITEAMLGRKARDQDELKAIYGALLAAGTDNDAKGVAAMIPGVQVSQITSAMRSIESRGRLRRANDLVVNFQHAIPIASLWGRGDKASADSMTLDTSRYLHVARMEHRRKQPGVGIYTHVRDTYSLFYDQPIVLNDRQAAVAVQGVEYHNASRREDQIRLTFLAVDTHGYTNAAMAIAKLLQFDLCVRLRQLAERMLFLPSGIELPENLERLKTGSRVSMRKIKSGWDELLRLVASIRDGRLTAREALERLGGAAKGDPLHAAADELGKMLRTIFLCDYFTKPDFRREMHGLLNRGESVHTLQRVIHRGRIGTQRGRRADELKAISGAHALLTNAVIAWNTMKMQQVVDKWKANKHPIDDDWVRLMGPAHFEHINFRGVIDFKVELFVHALVQHSETSRSRAAS